MIVKEIDQAALLADSYTHYTRAAAPFLKTGTVQRLVEEVWRKKKGRLEEKRILFFKEFEKDLPETTLPDPHLKFIFDSALEFAILSAPSEGRIQCVTKASLLSDNTGRHPISPLRDGKCIEVLLIISDYKGSRDRARAEPGIPFWAEEFQGLKLLLVEQVVSQNRGRMEFKVNKKKGMASISFRLPIERRKVFYFPAPGEGRRKEASVPWDRSLR
jgi:hypothetical protein